MGDSVPIPLNQINLTCSHTENLTLSTTVDNESIDTTLTLSYLNQSYRFRVVLEGMLPRDAPNPFGCSYLYTHSGSDCNSTANIELKETSLLIDVEAPTCSGWTKYYPSTFFWQMMTTMRDLRVIKHQISATLSQIYSLILGTKYLSTLPIAVTRSLFL